MQSLAKVSASSVIAAVLVMVVVIGVVGRFWAAFKKFLSGLVINSGHTHADPDRGASQREIEGEGGIERDRGGQER